MSSKPIDNSKQAIEDLAIKLVENDADYSTVYDNNGNTPEILDKQYNLTRLQNVIKNKEEQQSQAINRSRNEL